MNDVSGKNDQDGPDILGPLDKHLHPRKFRRGELLWAEGDTDGYLVSLIAGRIKIYRLLSNGKSITLYIFSSGSVFGFMPFFDDAPYPAYAQALDDCDTRVMSRSELRRAVRENPELALALMRHLSARLRSAFDTIERLQSRGTYTKVAAALYTELESSRQATDGPQIISLPAPSNEFAQLLGITPESFSRSITRLVDRGILRRLKRNSFQALDVRSLKGAAGDAEW